MPRVTAGQPSGHPAELKAHLGGPTCAAGTALTKRLTLSSMPLLLGHRGSPREYTENTLAGFQAALDAGLDGIERQLEPPPAIGRNIFRMTVREKRHHRVKELPADLREAVDELEKDEVIAAALGEHVMEHYVAAKRAEWQEYSSAVHAWELERYLDLV